LDIFESPSTSSDLIQGLEEGGGNDDK
jgi:hypothetical protein